jgi:hypothetical protein
MVISDERSIFGDRRWAAGRPRLPDTTMTKPRRTSRARTSVEILRERDELEARLRAIDEALAGIGAAAQHALEHPEASTVAPTRVAMLVCQARGK